VRLRALRVCGRRREGGRGVRLRALRVCGRGLKEIQDIWVLGLNKVLDYWFESLGIIRFWIWNF
jgi:hypothetical protein